MILCGLQGQKGKGPAPEKGVWPESLQKTQVVWDDTTSGMLLLRSAGKGARRDQVYSDKWRRLWNTHLGKINLVWISFLHSLIQNEYPHDGFCYSWLTEESLSLPYNFFRIGTAFNVPSLPPPILGYSANMMYTGIFGISRWEYHTHIISHLNVGTYKILRFANVISWVSRVTVFFYFYV